MAKNRMFPGIVLIGFGLYFFLRESNIELLSSLFTWPTLLCIVGIGFLFLGYAGKDYDAILPGVILAGLGIHFHLVNKFDIWPDHTVAIILIVALGFILKSEKTGTGMFYGILFVFLAVFLLFYQDIVNWLGIFKSEVKYSWSFIPLIFVLIGAYFLFKKPKAPKAPPPKE